ncbi:MAG: glycosyltransferase, partial [Flavobacteriaceae bacterium]|nr:glycosyltransferase [Flavobacteriaceae bacterium]
MSYLCTSVFYPFLQKISPLLLPNSEIEELETNKWKSKNNTSFFTLKSHYFKILSGWVSIHLELDSETSITPQISIDFGEGYSEINLINMHKIDKNMYQIEFMLPSKPKSICLYPGTTGQNIFSIKSLEIRAHSAILHMIKQLLSIIKHDYVSGAKPFRIIKKSYIRYKNHSIDVMMDQLEEEYKKIHPYSVQGVKIRKTPYIRWIEDNEKNNNEMYAKDNFNYQPLISVVMATYNTQDQYLKKAIDSVINQSYPNWELCIADDASNNNKTIEILNNYEKDYSNIKIVFRRKNGHISEATNSALALATGEFVAFLDHDDMLSKNALLEVNKVINNNPKTKFIYSDEDKIDTKGKRFEPHFKSGWNPDMFYSHNYLSHLSIIKKELIERVGGLRVGYEGAQDYDLLLRILDGVNENEIVHIEKILYHWRAIPGSTAFSAKEKEYTLDAGWKALNDYFQKKNENIIVEQGNVANTFKVSYPLPAEPPLVSILIPTRDGFNILSKCVESILEFTTYKNYEIIILDNETTDERTLEYFEELKINKNISILKYYAPFNYSAINNFGVSHAKGEIIALINNDTEIITKNWLTEMVQHALRPDIGAVGAMLYYDNNTIQHAGVVLGIGGVANHSHKGMKKGSSGYFARLVTVQNYSAVTGACLVVQKELYERVGGLNEK